MTKQTPKSCSCKMCKFGKHTKTGHSLMHADEKSFRQATKAALKKGDFENITPSPIGNYYD